MPLYNVRAATGVRGRLERIYSFKAADDEAARDFVVARLTSTPVELWAHSKRLARLGGKPSE